VKLGRGGALLVTREGEHHWKALPVDAVDTTAAGDTFNAAFAVGLTRGWSHERAGIFACTAAGLSVSRRGAQASMPTSAEVAAVFEAGRDVLLGGSRPTGS
jgi:ribokinase